MKCLVEVFVGLPQRSTAPALLLPFAFVVVVFFLLFVWFHISFSYLSVVQHKCFLYRYTSLHTVHIYVCMYICMYWVCVWLCLMVLVLMSTATGATVMSSQRHNSERILSHTHTHTHILQMNIGIHIYIYINT